MMGGKNIDSVLQEKDNKIEQEKMQREKLEQMVKDLEAQVVKGGEAIEEEKAKIEAKATREIQLKLKEKAKT